MRDEHSIEISKEVYEMLKKKIDKDWVKKIIMHDLKELLELRKRLMEK